VKSPVRPSDARLVELFRALDRSHAVLKDAVAAVPSARRTTSPGPGAWSAAQVLEHLVTVEGMIATLLRRLVSDGKASAPLPPSGFDPSRVLDRTMRFKTAVGEPSGAVTVDDSLRALHLVRADLKAAVSVNPAANLSAITAPHPIFGPLTVHDWLAFVAAHMRRHAAQIHELATG
jgi:uncharacterized damage-inducible protein DinB